MRFTIILLLFFSINIYAQDSLSYSYFDKKTYDLYVKQEWKELIKTSKKAFDKGYDSYYFQMRAGIAYYETKRYVKATNHFEKARKYNINPTLKEYLYYSYLYSGYNYKADYYSQFFTDTLKKKIGIKNNFLNSIDIFGGSFINNDFEELQNLKFHQTDKYASSSIRYKDSYNTTYGLGANISFGNRIKAYINYSYLSETKSQITKTNTYPFSPTYEIKEYENETKQSSFYFNLKHLSNNFTFTTSLNFINIKDTYREPNMEYGLIFYYNKNTSSSDIVFNLNFQRKISNFEIGLRTSYSNLNENRQLLAESEAIYYPFGNKSLYLIASTGFQNIAEKITTTSGKNNREKTSYSTTENNNISKIKLGFKTFNFLWIEAQAYFGRINEYNEANGFVVYNDNSPITSQYRLNFISPITKHLSIFVKYSYNTREQYFYGFKIKPGLPPEPPEPTLETETNYTKINNSSIIGGIKWTL